MWEETAVKDLKEVKRVFDGRGIKFWLDWGTLLGAVRDGKIIEWDQDIDLGTMVDSWDKIVSATPELEEKGFDVCLEEVKIRAGVFERCLLFYRFGRPVNIALYQVKGEDAWMMMTESTTRFSQGLRVLYCLLLSQRPHVRSRWGPPVKFVKSCLFLLPSRLRKHLADAVWLAWRRKGIKLFPVVIPKRYFENWGTIEFYGMTFDTPSDIENYLKYHYGEDWRTPKKEWEWHKDEGAVRAAAEFIP